MLLKYASIASSVGLTSSSLISAFNFAIGICVDT